MSDKQKRVNYVCDVCREDVLFEAFAAWDVARQENVLDSSFDEAFCPNCQGETTAVEVALPEKNDEVKERYFFVRLTIYSGEYEKSAFHLTRAADPEEAIKEAIEAECHNDPDYNEEGQVEDGFDFIYEGDWAKEISEDEFHHLRDLMGYTANAIGYSPSV